MFDVPSIAESVHSERRRFHLNKEPLRAVLENVSVYKDVGLLLNFSSSFEQMLKGLKRRRRGGGLLRSAAAFPAASDARQLVIQAYRSSLLAHAPTLYAILKHFLGLQQPVCMQLERQVLSVHTHLIGGGFLLSGYVHRKTASNGDSYRRREYDAQLQQDIESYKQSPIKRSRERRQQETLANEAAAALSAAAFVHSLATSFI